MNSRERVIRAIEHRGPDRVPVSYNVSPGFRLRYPQALADLRALYPSDFAETGFVEFEGYPKEVDVPETDAWQTTWIRLTDEHMGQAIVHPLADWSSLAAYRFPDPLTVGDWSKVADTLARQKHEKYVLVDGDTLFQRMFYLRGLEDLMLDIYFEQPEMLEVRDRVVEYMLGKVAKWLEYDVDGVRFRDDWGSQTQLLINPAKWRVIFKPAYKRLFDAVHAGGKHVFFHSDGNITEIIPDLIELGADVINPQVAAVGLEHLRALCLGRVCVMGDIDRQVILPFGTVAEVEDYSRQVALALGSPAGGYIGHSFLDGDVPPVNAEAMCRAFYTVRYEEGGPHTGE
ncbi:MAG: uroporphyrinogen decarboxylase family protein [Chloroflexota bacterium]